MRCTLYYHLDDFYAQAEQSEQPHLRGQPVVVGSAPFPQGQALSASREARDCGVLPPMPIDTAYQLCPQARFLTADLDKYRSVWERVSYLFADFTDRVELLALGEAWLDITGCPVTRSEASERRRLNQPGSRAQRGGMTRVGQMALFGALPDGDGSASWDFDAALVVERINFRLEREFGLTASVGVAASKGVARVASHCRRPGGLTIVPPKSERQFLSALPLSYLDLERAVEDDLRLLGLRTVGQLAGLPLKSLTRRFGPPFAAVHRLANGEDESPVAALCLPPELEVASVFDFGLRVGELGDHLARLAGGLAEKLGRRGLLGRVIILRLQVSGCKLTLSAVLKEHTGEAGLILRAAEKLLASRDRMELVEALTLALSDLRPPRPAQLTLVPNRESRDRAIRKCVLGLRQRYGAKTLLKVVEVPLATLPEKSFYLVGVE